MNNKEKAIQAHKELIDKYEDWENNSFNKYFNMKYCPLCTTFRDDENNNCIGCPMATQEGTVGCLDYITYMAASNGLREYIRGTLSEVALETRFEDRAEFHRKAVQILQDIPAKYFTEDDWEFEQFEKIHELQ